MIRVIWGNSAKYFWVLNNERKKSQLLKHYILEKVIHRYAATATVIIIRKVILVVRFTLTGNMTTWLKVVKFWCIFYELKIWAGMFPDTFKLASFIANHGFNDLIARQRDWFI